MKLASLFSDHAVLQRETSIPVWGWAKPLSKVSVKLGASEAHSVTGSDGRFLVRLPAMKASGPFTLEASCEGESAKAKDVCVGEVWLASGQSNMQMAVSGVGRDNETAELAASKDIRMATVPCAANGGGRQSDVNTSWRVADEDSVLAFSAAAAHFAKAISEELPGVKIGIINSSWGGTIAEAWTSRETLIRNPTQVAKILSFESDSFSPEFWQEKKGVSYPSDPGNEGYEKGWASSSFDDSEWESMELPGAWTLHGFLFSGVFWFRKTVEVPAAWAGKDLALRIGGVDKTDISFFNGEEVGRTGNGLDQSVWNVPRNYVVPGRLVKAGRNVIAVRAYSFIYDGGLNGPANKMALSLGGENGGPAIPLAGSWKFAIEQNFGLVMPLQGRRGPGEPNTPYILFDNMIAPLAPYALRGAIWYQGESNEKNSAEYEKLLKDMVADWRFHWGQGDFPFYVVQLANFNAGQPWSLIREAQLKLLSEPNTGMAVAIDIGEATDIHPHDKKAVGRRLALWALADVYGKKVEKSGPLYKSFSIEGSKIRLRFSHAESGLVSSDGQPLRHFEIASESKAFIKAEAEIDGDTVIVSAPDVKMPLAVRFAWSNNPEGFNFYNKAGLPASPFRTDSW